MSLVREIPSGLGSASSVMAPILAMLGENKRKRMYRERERE
ncbi:hypothetical protein [Curtanaerobium respiraculi]|nr:hypothetical protein [Curtanaerobium respiraculi]